MLEQFFNCPYCAEEISMLLDPSIRNQEYVEDCEVCCNPIGISAQFEKDTLIMFEAVNIDQ